MGLLDVKFAALSLAIIMQNEDGLSVEQIEEKIKDRIDKIKQTLDKGQWPRVIPSFFGALIEVGFDLEAIAPHCKLLGSLDEFSRTFDFEAVSRLCLDNNVPGIIDAVNLYPATELGALHKNW